MKKFWQLALTSLMALSLVTACGQNDAQPKENTTDNSSVQEEKAASYPMTLTDVTGNEVTLEEAPKAIVSMIPSNTEILYALGLSEEIVGVSDYDNYPEEAASKEKIGGMEFNVEKIISLNPDLVLAHESALGTWDAGLQQLRDAGVQVYTVTNAETFDATYETIHEIGEATGKTKEAAKIVEDMKAKIKEVQDKVAEVDTKKKVLVEVSPEPEIYTPAGNTIMNEMLDMINAENLVADLDGWIKIDPEEIVKRNPDVILTTYGNYTPDAVNLVLNRNGFSDVTAVKNKAVHDMDADLTGRMGPRLADGLELVAKNVYPEAFNE
ncbi:ABC transporter substrate-binding protein [Paenisporosarcina quisquiliarum]|uniref:ABC transporter substrate-binding protein n=1 Tax=Paenisporosarcina quisquiliarum TaxID=365346 RepID=UPI0037352258